MPLFGFQKQFADAVENGDKRQTIRAKRKIKPETGQTAHCYYALRTKQCRLLGRYEITGVDSIMMASKGVILFYDEPGEEAIDHHYLDTFAKDDGFDNWEAMRDWFKKNHGFPFYGDLVRW